VAIRPYQSEGQGNERGTWLARCRQALGQFGQGHVLLPSCGVDCSDGPDQYRCNSTSLTLAEFTTSGRWARGRRRQLAAITTQVRLGGSRLWAMR